MEQSNGGAPRAVRPAVAAFAALMEAEVGAQGGLWVRRPSDAARRFLYHDVEGRGAALLRALVGQASPVEIASDAAALGVAALRIADVVGGLPAAPARPTLVCLCGSTRFYDAYQEANYRETMAGKIVLTVGFYPHSAVQAHGEGVGCTPVEK